MSIFSTLRFFRKLSGWYFSGNRDLLPPPAPVKRWVLRRLAREHGLRVFVETGTYQGGTIASLQSHFDKIHSIELNNEFYQLAKQKFAQNEKVRIYSGDSGRILSEILAGLHEPALFWLDAHYSGGLTARGEQDTPIREELRAILSHPVAGHVIAIDDASDFGTGDYPTIKEITDEATKNGARRVRIRYNMILID